ncbi:uncharacterized protein SPPG_02813 [Spizellomyces punctatus DAOM BR117]|uniref:Uncharacterized protein n=1 Tax=Spizellomyces punctatus (strain DAOM BR117) TaxID=645134 RepID=A0A0L0HML4_SPIPD|nr:uncharacterized protein SPPG_02813 [Spizellomyces punctatus DAOM BR117]KND02342.1 hypothetical protein SPPG_02813 [Spizellomyces punctatus DAOM BR117]|eukprot:XP_016610381.1 hypothetical protein SPPG_02813 [Spizellomyces punctatus DAOM BR117]
MSKNRGEPASNPLGKLLQTFTQIPETDTFKNPPAPEDVAYPGVTPKREREVPPEHYHDFPNWERSNQPQRNQTPDEIHAQRQQETHERDMRGHDLMGSAVSDYVRAAEQGNQPQSTATPENKLGIVEPERVTEARKNRDGA